MAANSDGTTRMVEPPTTIAPHPLRSSLVRVSALAVAERQRHGLHGEERPRPHKPHEDGGRCKATSRQRLHEGDGNWSLIGGGSNAVLGSAAASSPAFLLDDRGGATLSLSWLFPARSSSLMQHGGAAIVTPAGAVLPHLPSSQFGQRCFMGVCCVYDFPLLCPLSQISVSILHGTR
ncbi:hypothetical protein HN51_008711 [Arachis hypogaea]